VTLKKRELYGDEKINWEWEGKTKEQKIQIKGG
jgi:hypothetical protein